MPNEHHLYRNMKYTNTVFKSGKSAHFQTEVHILLHFLVSCPGPNFFQRNALSHRKKSLAFKELPSVSYLLSTRQFWWHALFPNQQDIYTHPVSLSSFLCWNAFSSVPFPYPISLCLEKKASYLTKNPGKKQGGRDSSRQASVTESKMKSH